MCATSVVCATLQCVPHLCLFTKSLAVCATSVSVPSLSALGKQGEKDRKTERQRDREIARQRQRAREQERKMDSEKEEREREREERGCVREKEIMTMMCV